MSASTLMSLGIRAMAANYAALQVTGHNIANANVEGFSRQRVELSTAPGQFTGAGFFGRGVDVQNVVRSHDAFLTREASAARSLSAMDATRLEQLQRLESLFKTGEMGLGYAVSDLMAAMTDLTSRPADMATRQVVLGRASELASRFSEAARGMDDLQAGVNADLRNAVEDVNALATSLAEVNQKIVIERGKGQAPNDLLDERDRLLSRLSQQVQVTRIEAPDGSMSVFIGGGQRLVLGVEVSRLKLVPDAQDPARSTIGLVEGTSMRRLEPDSLGGGAMAGLLRFQNDDLVQARAQVGRMAAALGGALNEQQLRGVSLQQPLGSVPSSPLFSMGAPLALANVANARNSSGALIGQVALTITDPAALQASEYDLAETTAGSGSWVLTRLSDGVSTAVNSGDVVDGFRIDFSAAPQAGDRFLLQPVSRAASPMQALLRDGRDLAAASPLLAGTAPGNVGTAGVGTLRVTASPLPTPGATSRITFTSNSGDYNWEVFDPNNNLLASGSGLWQPGQTIPPSGVNVNGFELTITGVPRSGDVLTIEPTPAQALASNNGNALALLALRDAAIVGGRSPTDDWSHTMAEVGVRVQTARTASTISEAVTSTAEQRRSSEAGVNLDEEAARLIQYQQSYQAAAKVLQVAQSLFDTLLQTAGR